MVSLEGLGYEHLLIRFRKLAPFHQAVIVGLAFLAIYVPYSYFLLRLNLAEAVSMSIYSSIIFMFVYYFTSVIILKRSMQALKQSKGPKKGLRGK